MFWDQGNGLAGKGARHQVCQPELAPRDLCGGRRELIPTLSSDIPMHAVVHAYTYNK